MSLTLARFSEEENGVDVLFFGEQNADLRAEGRKKDRAISGKPIDNIEDGVDEVI